MKYLLLVSDKLIRFNFSFLINVVGKYLYIMYILNYIIFSNIHKFYEKTLNNI